MHRKRSKMLLYIIVLVILCVTARIFYLQVIDGNSLEMSASNQRMLDSKIETFRGEILDRNGIPFTDRSEKYLVVLKPLYLRNNDEELQKICEILNQDYSKLKKDIEAKKEPIIFETNSENKKKILNMNIQGVSIVNSLERYDGNSLAKHIMGYLNKVDNKGVAGLEKSYEKTLEGNNESTVGLVKDARDNPVQGLGYRIKNSEETGKLNVKLTLDYHIQKIAENVMEKYYESNGNSGAVVIEDVNSGDIVASVSKPDFDQNEVNNYLNSSGNELFNKATASYNLGSIFKIVDVAQALESGMEIDESYFCKGYELIGNREFKCTSYLSGGHGVVDLTKAFALSCNPYFMELGIRIGYKNILDMAGKFGLGSYTGIKEQGVNESSGNLPLDKKYFTEGDIANISIGQGDIMATPLQVTNMVATVANGGIKNRVNIVDSVIDSNGNKVKEIRENQGVRIISKETSDKIRFLMEAVISQGTGKKVDLEQYGGAGGKTASAETGQFKDGENVVQAWFTGYFPKKNPKYAMTVFVENGKMGGQAAAPIFTEIAKGIMKAGL